MNEYNLYRTKDLYNGDKWYNGNLKEMKKQADEYINECEGDCILEYRIFDKKNKKYKLMTESEIKKAKLPR